MDLTTFAKSFAAYALSKVKNQKIARDFRDKWVKDNYHTKVVSLFKAGIEDAKEVLDIPDKLIEELLEDRTNRSEVFRWILEGTTMEQFDGNKLFLEPYFERYPLYEEQIIPFFQLILLKIHDYKEKEWEPEFLTIIKGITDFREEMNLRFDRVEQQNERHKTEINDNFSTTLREILGPVEYLDLKQLLDQEKVVTAREKAEERLKTAIKNEDKLELYIIIANSYLYSDKASESIPYIHAAITVCNNDKKVSRLEALVDVIEKRYDFAIKKLNENLTLEVRKEDVQLLVNAHLLKGDLDECIFLLEKYSEVSMEILKAQVYLLKKDYTQALVEIEKQESKQALLLKSEIIVLQMEEDLLTEKKIDVKEITTHVQYFLEKVEESNENSKQLIKVKELKAALSFRNKRYKEASDLYSIVYQKVESERKEQYFNNLIYSLYLCKEWSKAEKLIKEKISERFNFKNLLDLGRVYLNSKEPGKALLVLEKYKDRVNNQDINLKVEYYLIMLNSLFFLTKHKELTELIKCIEHSESVELAEIINGYYSIRISDWDSAILKFENVQGKFNSIINQELLIHLVDALMKKGTANELEKVVNIIPTLKGWLQQEFLIKDYVLALYRLEEFEKILSFYYENEFEYNNLFLLEIVANIYYNSKWFEISSNLFEVMYRKTQDIKYLAYYSSCLYQLGYPEKCLEKLLLIENQIKEDAKLDDLRLMVVVYIEVMNFEKALEFAYKLFVHGKNSPDAWRFYFGLFPQLTNPLKEVREEYKNAFNRVTNDFHSVFPDEPVLYESFNLISGDGITNDFLGKLNEIQSLQLEKENYFEDNKLHGSFLTQLSKGDPFSIWMYMSSNSRLHFWARLNNKNLQNDGIRTFFNSRRVLCDIFSLFTLERLDLLKQFSKSIQPYVMQEQFSSFYQEYSQLKLSRNEGTSRIANIEGQVIVSKTTPEELENLLLKYEYLISWINNNCIKVGNGKLTSYKDDELGLQDPIILCKDSLLT
ncbi:PIN domain-containing protein [Alteribacter keqinensis]|uniref:PIN domain-containing protein n=1 Tax=Alteribacter keqinensis TaxID=2483800 RepID=UPI00115CAB22|nr:hypothetical protein [Alteribacter keqinensis]